MWFPSLDSQGLRVFSLCFQDDEASTPNAFTKVLQNCATCVAVTAALLIPLSATAADAAFGKGPAIPELSVLISGPPIKDAQA